MEKVELQIRTDAHTQFLNVDRMVQKAEKDCVEDETNKHTIGAKNSLENYCCTLRNMLPEESG